MKAAFIFDWYTDGDWHLDKSLVEQLLKTAGWTTLKIEEKPKHNPNLNFVKMFEQMEDDMGIGSVTYYFEGEKDDVLRDLRRIKSILMTSIHVGYTHDWLMEDIYNLFKPVEDFLTAYWKGEKKNSFYNFLSGNYEGTEISIVISEV